MASELSTEKRPVPASVEPLVDPRPPEQWPGFEDLVTEDDTPVDNVFSEKQQILLVQTLYDSWSVRPFVALANVGLFYAPRTPPLVPDMLLSLGVSLPEAIWDKPNRSYFVSRYGKAPEVVVEVVSNREGNEDGSKLVDYAGIGVSHYVIYDPARILGEQVLRVYRLRGGHLVPTSSRWLGRVGLGLRLWEGSYDDLSATWLRWCDQGTRMLPTGAEGIDAEQRRAEEQSRLADAERRLAEEQSQLAADERRRADAERQRAERAEQEAARVLEGQRAMVPRLLAAGLGAEQIAATLGLSVDEVQRRIVK